MAAIGELVLDVTIDPHGELETGDDRDADIRIGGGGQAANFCAWAVSLGERARLIARVGPDEAGRRLAAELAAGGVELFGPVGSEPTSTIAVLLGPGGERSFARQRGASVGLRPEDVDPTWLAGARLLHVPCYGLYREPIGAACRRAIALARAQGALLSVDLSSAADLRRYGPARLAGELASLRPALLFATEAEAGALGRPLDAVAEVAVTKLGAGGCRVLGRRVPAPTARAVDTSGAGDALAAAFCAAFLEGATPLEAAGRAVLVAARAVATPGARP